MKSITLILATLCIAMTLSAADSPVSPVGYWRFPGKAVMTLSEDGKASRIKSRGTWSWDDKSQRKFTVYWGNKTSLHFTLAPDNSKITFINQKGREIVVVRVSSLEADKQDTTEKPSNDSNYFGTTKEE